MPINFCFHFLNRHASIQSKSAWVYVDVTPGSSSVSLFVSKFTGYRLTESERGYIFGTKAECGLPENMPLPPTEPRKRNRASVAQRRMAIAQKAPSAVETRSDDEDIEPPSDDAKKPSSRSSVESETSDASLTDFRNRQNLMADQAASSSNARV